MFLIGAQPEHWHQLVMQGAVNLGNNNLTQIAHLTIVHNTRSSNNKLQHAIGCEYVQRMLNGYELTD